MADLNGDGRPDIAYYGEPKELVVLYNQGTNGWSAPKRWPIDDGQLEANALATGDLNGDGRTDLVLLGEKRVYFLAQKADHTLAEPQKIPFSGAVKSVQVLDVDGDGRNDLLLVNWESPTPFRFRLQDETGQLGPENYFTLPPIRSFLADQLEQNQKTYIVTIAQNSGRAQISDFTRKPAEAAVRRVSSGPISSAAAEQNRQGAARPALGRRERRRPARPARGRAGKRTDFGLFAEARRFARRAGEKFSTLAGVSDLAVADWDGDGKPEIFLLSADERQVGVTRLR